MRTIFVILLKHLAAVTAFSYVVAPQPQAPTPHPQTDLNRLPTLIELPQLGEGSQREDLVPVRPRETFEPCSPCPAPATPTICPAIKCPELICDVGKSGSKLGFKVVKPDMGPKQDVDLAEEEVKLRARFARRNKRDVSSIVDVNKKCNSNHLKLIMTESMSSNIVVSKVTIAERASNEIGGHFDVICTTGVFSYYVAAEQFCEISNDDITCFAYRRDDSSQRGLTLKSTDYQQKEDEALFGRTWTNSKMQIPLFLRSTDGLFKNFDQTDFDSGRVVVI